MNKELHAKIWLHPEHAPIVELEFGDAINEDADQEHSPHHIGHDVYKSLGEFKPSKLDHTTVAKEFHEHLAKHGFYSHSDVHPLVRSPKDNEHLSTWGKITTGRAKHEGWHSDSTSSANETKHPLVGVWSTKHGTHIRRAGEEHRIQDASKDGHVTVFDDTKAQHKASGHHDRWFVRGHNIRRFHPEHGLTVPGSKGKADQHFQPHEVHKYVAAKKESRSRFHENMKNWLKDNKGHKNYEKAHAFVKEHYPHLIKEQVDYRKLIFEKIYNARVVE